MEICRYVDISTCLVAHSIRSTTREMRTSTTPSTSHAHHDTPDRPCTDMGIGDIIYLVHLMVLGGLAL